MRTAAGFLVISKVICILKPVIHSGEFALFTLKVSSSVIPWYNCSLLRSYV